MADTSHLRHPLTSLAAGALVGVLAFGAAFTTGYAAELGPAAGPGPAVAAPQAPTPVPTPSCEPWQTITQLPVTPSTTPTRTPRPSPPPNPQPAATSQPGGTSVPTTSAPIPSVPVCRNAPPVPFSAPVWQPASVVGGERLGAAGVVTSLRPGTPAPPALDDVSYVVADLGTGQILAAKSPHAWLRPASTLKALAALALMPRLDPKRTVVASKAVPNANGSRVGILAGNPYSVANLFDALLMFSANDAAYALADAAGGYDATVALMNTTARRIGAFDTVTRDPSGLDEDGQRSSAYDLALIGRAAMRLPTFRTTVVKRTATFPGGKDTSGTTRPAFQIYNLNDLLTRYPGAIGIKPGRTDRAQHTFIGAATRGGRTLLVTRMGSTTGSWRSTAALLDWGFANAARVAPVGRLVDPGQAQPPSVAPPVAPATPTLVTPTPIAPTHATPSGVSTSQRPAAPSGAAVPVTSSASVPNVAAAVATPNGPGQAVVPAVMTVAWLGVIVGAFMAVRRLGGRAGGRRGRHER